MDPGQLLAGRFLLLARAGAGGMGLVYRAEDRLEGGWCAIKVLHADTSADRARFARECSLLADLHDPAIVRYVDQGFTDRGEPFLAMEWIEGTSLGERLGGSGLALSEAVALMRKLACAVATLHKRGIVHRDLKPSNVLLDQDDPTRPKLLDLGVVRPADGGFTLTGSIIGTPGYMAPEQARGERDVDARADVFALGCLLFKCVTGQAPFSADEPVATLLRTLLDEPPLLRELAPHAPEALEQLVAMMLAKDRGERPANAAEVAVRLEALDLQDVREPHSVVPRTLTDAERRVTCLVVGRFVDDASPTDDRRPDVAARMPTLQPVLDRMRARFDVLAGGTLVVSFRDAAGSAGDLATRGARCALALRSACPALRLVVATGSAVDTGRTMIGVTIDRAAGMLEELSTAHGHPIGVDKTTATLVESRFVVESTRRGNRLIAERESEGLRTLLGHASTFVGRRAELGELRHAFESCLRLRQPVAMLVTAAAGLGKSRLRHELLATLELEHPELNVWPMRGDPMSNGSAFGLVAPAVRRLASIMEDEPAERQRAKLAERVARSVPTCDVARVTDFLGELAAIPGAMTAEKQAARRDATLMGDQIRRAFADLLRADCTGGPVLIVVEDLQWGDLPSVRLLDAALHGACDRSLFVLALARPEVLERFPRLWSEHPLRRIELGSLSVDAARVLVRETLGPGVSQEIVSRVVERACGNAFFLEELIRAVAAGGGDALPETVLATVQARLDALPSQARRVLRAASVYGQQFSNSDVVALLGCEAILEVELSLAELVGQEIVARREAVRSADAQHYAFRHALVREAAYAMLTDDDRVLGHRLAAEHLERVGGADAVALAEHFERGAMRARAAPLWARAARQALEGNDLDQVVDRVERSTACGAAGALLGTLHVVAAEAYLWRGETAVAEHEAHQAMRTCPAGSPDFCKAAAVGATAAGRQGNHGARSEFIAAVLALPSEDDGDPDRLVTFAQCSIQLVFAGDLAGADQLLRRVDAIGAAALHDDAAAASVLRARAWRAMSAGDPGTYGAMMQAAADRFARVGDVRNACVQRVNVSYAESSVGQFEIAARGYREVVETAFRLGLAGVAAVARHNLGLTLAMLGRPDEAEREETAALQAFELQSDRRLQAMSLVYLAAIAWERADWSAAEPFARRALALLPDEGPPRAQALGMLARILVANGRAFEAQSVAIEAHDMLERLGGVDEGESLIRLAHAEALEAVGLHPQACAAIERARDRLLERAARITTGRWRESFLERVPENAQTIALASRWLGSAPR